MDNKSTFLSNLAAELSENQKFNEELCAEIEAREMEAFEKLVDNNAAKEAAMRILNSNPLVRRQAILLAAIELEPHSSLRFKFIADELMRRVEWIDTSDEQKNMIREHLIKEVTDYLN